MKIKVKNYRIGEIASFYGISLDAARLYDKKGILSPVKDTSNNYRSYSREDLVTMDYIIKMRKMEFSLDEINAMLNEDSLSDMRDAVTARASEIGERIEELQLKLALLRDYRDKLDYCVDHQHRIEVVEAPPFICSEIDDSMDIVLSRFEEAAPGALPLLTVFPEKDFMFSRDNLQMLTDIACREEYFDYMVTLEDKNRLSEKPGFDPEGWFTVIPGRRYIYTVGHDATDKDYTDFVKVLDFVDEQQLKPKGPPFFRMIANEFSSSRSNEYMEMFQPVE